MALIVQDDNGTVAGANGYISADEFRAYHDARLNSYAVYDDDEKIEGAVLKATSYLDGRFRFRGRRLNGRDQRTEWPRANCYDNDRCYVLGVPPEVKEACAEYALRSLASPLVADPTYHATGRTVQSKSEKVDVLEESVTFVEGAGFKMPKYPEADRLLTRAGLTEAAGEIRRG